MTLSNPYHLHLLNNKKNLLKVSYSILFRKKKKNITTSLIQKQKFQNYINETLASQTGTWNKKTKKLNKNAKMSVRGILNTLCTELHQVSLLHLHRHWEWSTIYSFGIHLWADFIHHILHKLGLFLACDLYTSVLQPAFQDVDS